MLRKLVCCWVLKLFCQADSLISDSDWNVVVSLRLSDKKKKKTSPLRRPARSSAHGRPWCLRSITPMCNELVKRLWWLHQYSKSHEDLFCLFFESLKACKNLVQIFSIVTLNLCFKYGKAKCPLSKVSSCTTVKKFVFVARSPPLSLMVNLSLLKPVGLKS